MESCDCPKCEAEIEIENLWEAMGKVFVCPGCGAKLELESDYTGESSWSFWLVNFVEWKGGDEQAK